MVFFSIFFSVAHASKIQNSYPPGEVIPGLAKAKGMKFTPGLHLAQPFAKGDFVAEKNMRQPKKWQKKRSNKKRNDDFWMDFVVSSS